MTSTATYCDLLSANQVTFTVKNACENCTYLLSLLLNPNYYKKNMTLSNLYILCPLWTCVTPQVPMRKSLSLWMCDLCNIQMKVETTKFQPPWTSQVTSALLLTMWHFLMNIRCLCEYRTFTYMNYKPISTFMNIMNYTIF